MDVARLYVRRYDSSVVIIVQFTQPVQVSVDWKDTAEGVFLKTNHAVL